jgi:hypothetical protein
MGIRGGEFLKWRWKYTFQENAKNVLTSWENIYFCWSKELGRQIAEISKRSLIHVVSVSSRHYLTLNEISGGNICWNWKNAGKGSWTTSN